MQCLALMTMWSKTLPLTALCVVLVGSDMIIRRSGDDLFVLLGTASMKIKDGILEIGSMVWFG